MTSAEVEERLKKQLETKGRGGARLNFNIVVSEQMRSLKFKKKTHYTHNNSSSCKNKDDKDR